MIARLAVRFLQSGHLLAMTLAVVAVAGLSSIISLPRVEDPRITNRNPVVLTFVPGASAERVEALVTEKLEERLQEVPEIATLDSTSRAGISVITIELSNGVTSETSSAVFSDIRDKLADARADLPAEALDPDFDDKRGAVAYARILAFRWQAASPVQMGVLTRLGEELSDRLRNVAGTEIVRLFGESEEEMTVTVDADELAALGLSTRAVANRVAAADAKVPAGLHRGADRDWLLEVRGQLDSVARIAAIPLLEQEDGALVRLGDVADVRRDWREPPTEVGLVEGARSVYVAVRMQPDRRADRWGESIDVVVDDFRAEMGDGVDLVEIFDQTRYTRERLSELGGNLLAGAAVIGLVILLTLGWRASIFVGLALPLSASLALFGLGLLGGTLQQMSIFGMIIALGLLIDNAIVVVDEVLGLLRSGRTRAEALREAVDHLSVPLFASTLTTVLAFMPILLLRGNVGDFVGAIGVSVILALIASFGVALTLVAALAARFGDPAPVAADARWWKAGIRSPSLVRRSRDALGWLFERPVRGLGVAVAPALVGFVLASTLGSQFFPRVDRDMFDIRVWLPREASVARTRRLVEEIDTALRGYDGVERISWLAGGSFPSVYYNLVMREDATSYFAQGVVDTESFEDVRRLLPRVQRDLTERFPEAQILLRRFAQGPPVDADVEFTLVGPSIDVLQRLGDEVREVLAAHPGILHTRVAMERGEPKVWVDADENEARHAGLSLRDVATQLDGQLEGHTGGSVVESLEELPVRIRTSQARRARLDEIATTRLVLGGADGGTGWLPLDALGELELRPEIGAISRCDGLRCNEVLGFTAEGVLAIEVARDVEAELQARGFRLPSGYRLTSGGDAEEQADAVGQLAAYAPVLGVVTLATLVIAFGSLRIALLLAGVAGLSVGMGLLATWTARFPISFNTLLGIAGLIGVALNDSIVVLAAIRADDRARMGDVASLVRAVMGTGRHVVSTTLTTIGGFLPLLIFTGGDFWPPLAIVLAGGVGGATLLAMVFTPAAYRLLEGRPAPARTQKPGSPWRILAEKSGASSAARAFSPMSLADRSSSNGRLVSTDPRS